MYVKRTIAIWSFISLFFCCVARIEADDHPAPANQAADEAALKARIEERRAAFQQLSKGLMKQVADTKNEVDRTKAFSEIRQAEEPMIRELMDMAMEAPKTQAARDAFLIGLNSGRNASVGSRRGEALRAAQALLTYHGDDPLVVSHAVELDNIVDPLRDLFIHGVYATAKSRESKGLARLALARYLRKKSAAAQSEQTTQDYGKRVNYTYRNVTRKDGTRGDVEVEESNDQYTVRYQYGLIDPDEAEKRARELFDEVIRDYDGVEYHSAIVRKIEGVLASGSRELDGRELTDADLARFQDVAARPKKSLADMAIAGLDDWDNLEEGKPAPEIDAEGVDGKRFKLSDYRGKVVVLIFWGTWCAPCMAAVPHEREMAEKYKDKPVALLGVDCDPDRTKALEVMKKEGITWPNWYDGDPGEGPIAQAYHIRSYPTAMVIDAEGKIRMRKGAGKSLERLVDKLLAEMQSEKKTD